MPDTVLVSPTEDRPQLCHECQADLADALHDALVYTPNGADRTSVTCLACGTLHVINLAWTPRIVGVYTTPPDQIGPVPHTWTFEEILRREG